MKIKRRHMIYIAVFAALLLLLYLLLVFTAVIPNSTIKKNMRKSATYFATADHYAFSEDGLFRNITDNHADRMWVNIGWNMGHGNPFLSVLDTDYYASLDHGPEMSLFLSVALDEDANTGYTRYWHGTAGVIRALHLLFNLHGIKILGMICLFLLIGRTLWVLYRRGHWDLSLCLLISLLSVQIWNLRLSVEYQPCFLICFALCPAFLRAEKQGNFYLNLLAIISGTLTAFFDFLTTETVTILIPLILVTAIRSRECRLGSPKKTMRFLLHCGLCWALAYLGTFAVKWCAVSLATGSNHFITAMHSVGQRVGGAVTEGNTNKMPGMLMAIGSNLSVIFEGTSRTEYRNAISNLMIIAILIFVVWRMYRVRKTLRPGTGFILLLGGVVLLRFGLLANHSYLHSFFTYRALASTIFAVLAAMLINLHTRKRGGGRSHWS